MTTPEVSRGPKRSAQNDCTPRTTLVQVPETEGANRGGADAELTRRINEEHRACERAGRVAVAHAVRCGEMLITKKAAVGHGAWTRWLADNFAASKDTARDYMNLARNREEVLETKTERARFSSIRSALSSLAPRSPRRFGKARSSTPASCSSTAGSSGVCEGLGDVMLVPGNQRTEAQGVLLRHWSGGGDAAMICRVPEEAQNAKEFLSAASRALGAERCEGHILIYVSQDPEAGKAILQALRHCAPQEEEPSAEDYGDDEEGSKEDWERYEKGVLRQMEKAERSDPSLYQAIRAERGIKVTDDREEYRCVPNSYRGPKGLPGDEMADHLRENYPKFGITCERDLIDKFSRGRKT